MKGNKEDREYTASQKDKEPKPEETTSTTAKPAPDAAKPLWPVAPVPLGPPLPESWSTQEIKEATAECDALMRNKPINFEPLPPIREGVCGTPAPIRLKGFAYEPPLEMRPAPTMNCKLAVLLHQWLTDVVQPKAKELLQASVVRLGNLAAYDCRARNGDNSQRMSNHAYAKAIDISGFITAKGEVITVLEHWPLEDERGRFLKEVHDGACKIFGTVLGPDANEAHKNHFHLDAEDRRRSLCDFYDRSKISAGKAPEKAAEKPSGKLAGDKAADAKNTVAVPVPDDKRKKK